MNDDTSIGNTAYQRLSDKQLTEIDELCDRFDRELLNGVEPRIESYLIDVPKAAEDGLLTELLSMELEYRIQQGEVPKRGNYTQRFPSQENVIARVFAHKAEPEFPSKYSNANVAEVTPEIDNFRLLAELGSGGMGVVWLAEQILPVKRRVALKLIKSELTANEIIGRFDSEKQSLAMMNHPNIAQALDAGTSRDGRPYFVMEFIDGSAITQYCDDNKLSVDERLELFVSVCKAVQHAHQKGIIHRDLKPSKYLCPTESNPLAAHTT